MLLTNCMKSSTMLLWVSLNYCSFFIFSISCILCYIYSLTCSLSLKISFISSVDKSSSSRMYCSVTDYNSCSCVNSKCLKYESLCLNCINAFLTSSSDPKADFIVLTSCKKLYLNKKVYTQSKQMYDNFP